MSKISVAGGYYQERCLSPSIDEFYGSGGRAAMALARNGVKVDWHYYCPEIEMENSKIRLSDENLTHHTNPSNDLVTFQYLHPLSKPLFFPAQISKNQDIRISDDVILRFGYMEGDAVVKAQRCVYDPQSPNEPVLFKKNGSEAEALAIILNSKEVLLYGNADNEIDAIKNIHNSERPDLVIVKAGMEGCRIYEHGKETGYIPPYWSNKVYKIGSGDVFSAAFSYQWGISNKPVLEAANISSQCVARYCESRAPVVDVGDEGESLQKVELNRQGRIYIAGPFFTMAELWLIEEVCAALSDLNIPFFSPYHHVGLGTPNQVVEPDLKGLVESTAVLAILDGCDPGTLFEIGYAVKHGIPVIGFSQNSKKSDQTMLLGSANCFITDDFSTAIYHSAWRARN